MKNTSRSPVVIKLIIAAFIFLAAPQIMMAQTTYTLSDSPDAFIKVSGKSNVHDWDMTSTKMESQGKFKFTGEILNDLTSLSFSLPAKSLKSGKSSMDNRTYKSINAEKYPAINYRLTSATVTSIQKDKYLIKTKGALTIAGVTQPITIDVTAVINPNNTITCTGKENIQLTDYGIKPPTFMLGAMKVYNDLTIQFNLIYKK